ncbi:MAG: adenylate/guanylate cyclase domain-containing protein [Synechococcus sp.]|nr:adenylate/guanylate cyclase domain-containing protein [Synechococcus sp.]
MAQAPTAAPAIRSPAPAARIAALARWLRPHAAAVSTALLVTSLGWRLAGPLHQWELSLTGFAQEWRGPRRLQAPVTIVAIDDYSFQQVANADLSGDPRLARLQQWPWPRRIHALVLDRLLRAGARAVAFDLLFETRSELGPADDGALAAALRRHSQRSVLATQVMESRGEVAQLALSLPSISLFPRQGPRPGLGLLNAQTEADGSLRRRPGDYALALRRSLGEAVPQGLALSLLQHGGASDRSQPPLPFGRWLPLLDPYGPPRSIPTLSIWQLLESAAYQRLLASGRLRGQLILVGPTALVLQDLHRAPFSGGEGTAGVELHATELANRIEGRSLWLWTPGLWWWSCGLAILVLVCGLLAERWDRPLQRLAVLAAVALALVLLAQLAIAWLGVAPNLFNAAAAVLLMALVSSGDATLRLQWQRWRLRQALGRYLSPAVAAEIANQPAEADGLLGGRSMNVVILLSDIRGFTSRTRQMSQAGQVRELVHQLNVYFSEIVDVVHSEGGTVDKFIGDATLAVFGVPYSRGDHQEASSALRAAVEIHRRLERLNQRWSQEGKEPWEQVVILNFGTVISGNIGSSHRMDYTVIGEAVNATSRLEYVAKQCGRNLILSHAFVEQLHDRDRLEHLGDFELRGHGLESVYGLLPPAETSSASRPPAATEAAQHPVRA